MMSVTPVGFDTRPTPTPPPPSVARTNQTDQEQPVWFEDRVDLTGMRVGEAIDMLEALRLAEIRRQIKTGDYLTGDKLDIVAARLADAISMAAQTEK